MEVKQTEALYDVYYKKLFEENSTNFGNILAHFFWELYGLQPKSPDIIMFNKLIKMYGKVTVFKAIVVSYDINNIDFTKNIYPLFSFLSKKIATEELNKNTNNILDIGPIESKLEKIKDKKLKIELEFGDGEHHK